MVLIIVGDHLGHCHGSVHTLVQWHCRLSKTRTAATESFIQQKRQMGGS